MSASAVNAIVNSAAYADGRRVADVRIDEIGATLCQPDRFVWIGLHEPDEELLKQVQKEFGLHDLAIEDAHRAHQRPKLERYGECIFVVLRTGQRDRETRKIVFGETHLFVGARYVVSVRHGPSLSYAEVRARCETTPQLLSKGPGFVLYALMDFVVDQYFPIVEALEDEIFGESFTRETTQRIYQLKRDLLEMKRATWPLIDVCNRLVRYDFALIPEDTRPYFRDVYDHAVRIKEMIDTLRELLSTALEASLSLQSVAQNESMKRLAGLVAIIAVPTAIAGHLRNELSFHAGTGLAVGLSAGAGRYGPDLHAPLRPLQAHRVALSRKGLSAASKGERTRQAMNPHRKAVRCRGASHA